MTVKKALMFTAILVVAGLLVAGCGGNQNSSSAKQVLDKALANLRALKSFKVTLKASSASSSSAPTTTRSDYEVTTEGGLAMHSTTDQGGQKTDAYLLDGVAYANPEGQGWLKQDASGTKAINVDVADSLKTGTKDLKILSQDANSYRLSFKMSTPTGSAQDGSSPSSAETSATTEFVVKVDKPTMNIQEISVKAPAATSSGNQAQEETVTFSGQNSPITIQLPEEAKNAKSAPEQSAPGSSGL
jgi:hypothetical protein